MSSLKNSSHEPSAAPGTYRAIWWVLGFRLVSYALVFGLIIWTSVRHEIGYTDFQIGVIKGMGLDPETYDSNEAAEALGVYFFWLCVTGTEALLLRKRKPTMFYLPRQPHFECKFAKR